METTQTSNRSLEDVQKKAIEIMANFVDELGLDGNFYTSGTTCPIKWKHYDEDDLYYLCDYYDENLFNAGIYKIADKMPSVSIVSPNKQSKQNVIADFEK